jgi:type I restriction enzyme S subunit
MSLKWKKAALGAHCIKIGSGATPRGGESVYQSEGTAFIRSQNVYNGRFEKSGLAFLDEEKAEELKNVTVDSGDILLNITGDSVARCCRVADDVLPARVSQHVCIIRPNPREFDPQFLMYYFISPYMQSVMLSLAGSGGTRKALTKEMIEKFVLPKPELPVQRRIACILSKYDELIENNNRRISLLEEYARLIFREWFFYYRFPNHEHVKIVNGLPEGWQAYPLKKICPEIRKIIEPKDIDSDTPYIGLEHMPQRSISLSNWGSVDEVTSTKHQYNKGDIIFGKIRPYFHKVGITFTDGVASSDAIILRPVSHELLALCLLTVSSDHFIAEASKTAKEGSKMPRADWKLMEKRIVPVPPPPLLDAFNVQIEPIMEQLRTLSLASRKLQLARQMLITRIMSEGIIN